MYFSRWSEISSPVEAFSNKAKNRSRKSVVENQDGKINEKLGYFLVWIQIFQPNNRKLFFIFYLIDTF